MSPRRIAVVSAGLSVPSSTRMLADRLAAATARSVGEADGRPEVEVVELRDLAHDLMNNLLAGFPSEGLRRAIETVVGADGLIVVTPVFNASYSGLFKSFFDVLEPGSLDGMPVLIAATGGTARHSLALEHAVRPMFAYLRSSVVPSAVFAASEDWAGGAEAGRGLADRIDRAAAELATAMTASPRRESVDPFESPVPFEQLLAQR
ncbi:FMN reductase [Rhodococcus sp. NPDC059234]|uniref:FMN reductase n=1 Tax=Rhodococcus sp. NPDC059234 TaxID=3346781 RepID=UPI00366EF463